jgi:hypothetical protein
MDIQMFSKPIMFLSIATRITEKLDELRPIKEPTVTGIQNLHEESPVSENGAIVPAVISTDNIERFALIQKWHHFLRAKQVLLELQV